MFIQSGKVFKIRIRFLLFLFQPGTIHLRSCHYQVNCEIAAGGSSECATLIHSNCNLATPLNTADWMVRLWCQYKGNERRGCNKAIKHSRGWWMLGKKLRCVIMLIHAEEVCDKDKWSRLHLRTWTCWDALSLFFQKCVAVLFRITLWMCINYRCFLKRQFWQHFRFKHSEQTTEQRDNSHLRKGLLPRILTRNSGDDGACSIEVLAPATEEWFLIQCYHLSTYLSPVGSVQQAYYTIPTPPFLSVLKIIVSVCQNKNDKL